MEELFKWLSVTHRYTQIELDRRLKKYGINAPQHVILIRICENPGISQDRIQESVYINASNVTRAIAQLEKAHLVIRKTAACDKRVKELYPTPQAQEAFQEICEEIAGWKGAVTADLTMEEKEQLGLLIKKVGRKAMALVDGEAFALKDTAL